MPKKKSTKRRDSREALRRRLQRYEKRHGPIIPLEKAAEIASRIQAGFYAAVESLRTPTRKYSADLWHGIYGSVGAAPPAEARRQPFIPTPFQERILEVLHGMALHTDALKRRLKCGSRLFRKPHNIQELVAVGLVFNNRAIGYYRKDAPPHDFAKWLQRPTEAVSTGD